MMFTSVEVNEELYLRAWNLSGIKTKKAFFDEVLRTYVQLYDQAQVTSLRGKLVWDGNLDDLRKDRGADPR
jgi:Arc/MetJ family transcription regulator